MSPRRLLRCGLAAIAVSSIALLMAGSGVGVQTTTASAAGSACKNGFHSFPTCFYLWHVTRVTRARTRHGRWRSCVSFAQSKHTAQATCSLGSSRSTTVTTTLTGSLEVPRGQLSAAVGYQVQQTSSVTASYTASIPAHHAGVIQWAPLFNNRRKVQQRRSTCRWYASRRSYASKCTLDAVYRYVYTEQYSHPRFRVRFR
jgi:hypothetical protein